MGFMEKYMLFCSTEIIYYSDFIKFAYENCTNIYRNHEKLNTLYIYVFCTYWLLYSLGKNVDYKERDVKVFVVC